MARTVDPGKTGGTGARAAWLGTLGLVLAAIGLAGCAAGQASTANQAASEPLALAVEWSLELQGRPSGESLRYLGIEDEPRLVDEKLEGVMERLSEVVTSQAPRSEAVRWAINRPNPRLQPDHRLDLKLLRLRWVAGREEGTVMPRVELRIALTELITGRLLFSEQEWISSVGAETRGARDLNLEPLYADVCERVVELVEAARTR